MAESEQQLDLEMQRLTAEIAKQKEQDVAADEAIEKAKAFVENKKQIDAVKVQKKRKIEELKQAHGLMEREIQRKLKLAEDIKAERDHNGEQEHDHDPEHDLIIQSITDLMFNPNAFPKKRSFLDRTLCREIITQTLFHNPETTPNQFQELCMRFAQRKALHKVARQMMQYFRSEVLNLSECDPDTLCWKDKEESKKRARIDDSDTE